MSLGIYAIIILLAIAVILKLMKNEKHIENSELEDLMEEGFEEGLKIKAKKITNQVEKQVQKAKDRAEKEIEKQKEKERVDDSKSLPQTNPDPSSTVVVGGVDGPVTEVPRTPEREYSAIMNHLGRLEYKMENITSNVKTQGDKIEKLQQRFIESQQQRSVSKDDVEVLKKEINEIGRRTSSVKYDSSSGLTVIDGKLLLSNPIQSSNPNLGFSFVHNNKLMFGENAQVPVTYLST